jgi:hypothetical protein
VISRYVATWHQHFLNKAERREISRELKDHLLANDGLIGDALVNEIELELEDYYRAYKLGKSEDDAAASLKAARSKLDELKKKTSQSSGPTPEIAVIDPDIFRTVDEVLDFVIINPDANWQDSKFVWSTEAFHPDSPKGWLAEVWRWVQTKLWQPKMGTVFQDGRGLQHRIASKRCRIAGSWAVGVKVDGKTLPTRNVTIKPSRRAPFRFVSKVDRGIEVFAVLLAVVISFLTLDQLDSFGTLRDYFFAFLGGFGLSATTKGFTQVRQGVRTGG